MDVVDHLIDISGHNSVSDWRQVADNGIVATSVKVSQANNFLNRLRAGQVTGARAAGVAPGGYHFGDHRYDARSQARYFVQHGAALGLFDAGSLAPMYDVENWQMPDGVWVRWQSRQQISDHIGIWLDVLAEETDVDRALVYGSQSWWGSLLVPDDWRRGGIEVLNWVALYNGRPGNLGGWSDPRDALHQHTSDGIVPGIDGRVDKNVTLRGRRLPGLLIGGDDVSAVEVWSHEVPLYPDQDDPDQRPSAQAAEALGRSVQAGWASVDYAKAANAKLDALLGRDPVDEVELARELIAQGLGAQLGRLPEDQFVSLVRAVADESDRRAAHRADVTVPAPGGGA